MTAQSSNLVAAARELLRLKDLKTDAAAIETSGSWTAVHRHDAMLTEYRAKKGGAWDALRRALQGETGCSCRSPGEMYDRDCSVHGQHDETPAREWRCFHCDEVFTEPAEAREHFGPSLMSDAACHIDITEYRRMEENNRRHCEEDTELHRALYAKEADHQVALRREEEKGYERGLRDGRLHPETTADAEDAAKWRALRNCARITSLGSAGLHDSDKLARPDAHVCLNFWTHNQRETETYPREWLDQFVAKCLRLAEKAGGVTS